MTRRPRINVILRGEESGGEVLEVEARVTVTGLPQDTVVTGTITLA
jgi:hypothetical protein